VSSVPVPEELRATKRSTANWLRSPQRVFLRRAIFQVHLWLGALLAAYAIVIGLTGSALIFKGEIERAIQPSLYHITPVPSQLTLDDAVHRIEFTHPGWIAFALLNFDRGEHATDLLMRSASGASTPNYRVVSFDPYTGKVLLDRLRYAGVLGFLSNLHVYLLSGEEGLIISGWMALGLLLLCLSGLILWWPGVQRWASALRLKTSSNWRRLNWDLHTVVGFWSSTAFLIVILTGLDFAFPGPAGKVIELVTGGGFHSTGASAGTVSDRQVSSDTPVLTIDQAISAATRALPADAPPGYLQLPSTARSPYKITGYYKNTAPYSQLVRLVLDSHTGDLLALDDTRKESRGSRIEQYFVAVHFGLFGGDGVLGLLVKILWVLLGLVPALLAVTGLLMYWNRNLRMMWRRIVTSGVKRI
jgi:uncharacterized iron-regulated membrane protein